MHSYGRLHMGFTRRWHLHEFYILCCRVRLKRCPRQLPTTLSKHHADAGIATRNIRGPANSPTTRSPPCSHRQLLRPLRFSLPAASALKSKRQTQDNKNNGRGRRTCLQRMSVEGLQSSPIKSGCATCLDCKHLYMSTVICMLDPGF